MAHISSIDTDLTDTAFFSMSGLCYFGQVFAETIMVS